jgi:hypothetical protein
MVGHFHHVALSAAGEIDTIHRVAGVAVIGVGLAAVGAWIWIAVSRYRPPANNPFEALGREVLGEALGALVVASGTLGGFALLQVRPYLLAGAAALIMSYALVHGLTAALPAVERVPQWLAVSGVPVALVLVTLTTVPGWPRLAGLVLLPAILAMAWMPSLVQFRLQSQT